MWDPVCVHGCACSGTWIAIFIQMDFFCGEKRSAGELKCQKLGISNGILLSSRGGSCFRLFIPRATCDHWVAHMCPIQMKMGWTCKIHTGVQTYRTKNNELYLFDNFYCLHVKMIVFLIYWTMWNRFILISFCFFLFLNGATRQFKMTHMTCLTFQLDNAAWEDIWFDLLPVSLKQIQKVKVKSLSCVRLFATPWAVAHQAPPSMGFSRQEYWSGLPFPSPGDLPNPGIRPRSSAL